MTQAEVENHAEIAERFLQHAEEEFERGDLPQASEKAWGAVAHYLKSVAKSRGWRNRSHSELSDILLDLAHETDEPGRVEELFVVMNGLHVNFYEDWLPDEIVGVGIESARELISRLDGRSGPVPDRRPSQTTRRRHPR